MFDVDKKLKAIMEGATVTGTQKNWYADDNDEGGINDQMFLEGVFDLFMAEAELPTGLNESSFEGITLAQLLREVTEQEIKDDVAKQRTRWQKFKEGLKRFFDSPANDPYGGLKELKAVNELIKDDMSVNVSLAVIPFFGLFLVISSRAKKYKDFPKEVAAQYVAEGKKHREYLNKIASNLEKEDGAKYKKAVKRVRSQIKHLDEWLLEFERRAVDKAVI
jgi:hypothetical protein